MIDVRPLVFIIAGISIGSPAGIMIRTHHMLEPVASSKITTSFDQRGTVGPAPTGPGIYSGVLFTEAGVTQCARLTGSSDQHLRSALKTSSLHWAPLLDDAIKDDRALKQIVSELCRQ